MIDDDADVPTECTFKHILCFFMCYDVRPQMARFLWLLALVLASIALFFSADVAAKQTGYGNRFSVPLHLLPLVLLAMAHIPLLGLQPDETTNRSMDSNVDRIMVRITVLAVLAVIALAIALSTTIDLWWSAGVDEYTYVHGAPPPHASIAPANESSTSHGNYIPSLLRSPTRTPSQTPSQTPRPEVREREYQQMTNAKSTVGALYMISCLTAAGTLVLDYNLRMVRVYH